MTALTRQREPHRGHRLQRPSRAAAALLAVALAAAACGSDSDSGSDESDPPTGGGTGTLAGVCPDPVVAQTGWFPEAERGALYHLLGDDYTIDYHYRDGFYDGVQNLKNEGDSIQYGGPHLCAGWKFPTADGKARFRPVPLPPAPAETNPGPAFRVATRRGKQFNSLIYAEVDPINGAWRDAVLMNPEDAAALHLIQNDRVRLRNELGTFEGRVLLAPIARGNLQIHWPEGNVLIPRGITDPTGGVPDYNALATVERVGQPS